MCVCVKLQLQLPFQSSQIDSGATDEETTDSVAGEEQHRLGVEEEHQPFSPSDYLHFSRWPFTPTLLNFTEKYLLTKGSSFCFTPDGSKGCVTTMENR